MEKRDYYEVLGVARDADGNVIKSAYRRCAKQYHPDVNPGDHTAEERFKEAAEAYEILSDPEKRALYDRFGHAGPRQAGFEGFSGVEDIFSHFADIFGFGGGGRGGRQRGADLQAQVKLDFMEAVKGCKKDVTVERKVPCATCGGSGAKPGTRPTSCSMCGGRGQVLQQMGFVRIASTCPTCRGQGQTIRDKCEECHGGGVTRKTETLTLEVPAGVEDGMQMQVRGHGQAAAGRAAGNLYVTFAVENDKRFEREGDDLHTSVYVTYPQAVLGCEVTIPTIDGDEQLQVAPGTLAGTVQTMRGRGVPHVERRGRGDLHVHVQIAVPIPDKLSDEQRDLIERLNASFASRAPAHDEAGDGLFRRRKKQK